MGRTEPMYLEAAEVIRNRIRSGELAPGERTPTDRELAADQGIGRATAARALELLVSEGLVTPGLGRAGRKVRDTRILPVHASRTENMERRRGAGVDAWVTDTREAGRVPGQSVDVSVVHAPTEVAKWLELEENAPVAVRRRVRTLDGSPSNQADTYYPMDVAQAIAEILSPDDVPQGVLALMADQGYETETYVDALQWRPPTPEEARVLSIGQGVSVLIQTRTGYQGDRPIHTTQTTWPGHNIELRYELPA